MGSAEGLSPSAGRLRVSLRYNFFPFLTRKGTREPALNIVGGDDRKWLSAPCQRFRTTIATRYANRLERYDGQAPRPTAQGREILGGASAMVSRWVADIPLRRPCA